MRRPHRFGDIEHSAHPGVHIQSCGFWRCNFGSFESCHGAFFQELAGTIMSALPQDTEIAVRKQKREVQRWGSSLKLSTGIVQEEQEDVALKPASVRLLSS